jgi:hypothetical protein
LESQNNGKYIFFFFINFNIKYLKFNAYMIDGWTAADKITYNIDNGFVIKDFPFDPTKATTQLCGDES